jgi:hypothetical protein
MFVVVVYQITLLQPAQITLVTNFLNTFFPGVTVTTTQTTASSTVTFTFTGTKAGVVVNSIVANSNTNNAFFTQQNAALPAVSRASVIGAKVIASAIMVLSMVVLAVSFM